jgi:aspartate-semialdehyde dehydrogenase
MNSNFRSAGVSTTAAAGLYRIAIVGAASLKGKEVAEVLEQRNFPAADVRLLDDDETLGQLEAVKDEITFIQSIRAEQFEHVDFTFFASDAECTRANWKQVQQAGSAIVDLSYALEAEPGATVRAPWLERQLGNVAAPELQPGPAVIAHPASVVLALLLSRLETAIPVARAIATLLEPASEHGQKGMDELHQQTVNLLSFQPLPKQVFDSQVAFNMISQFGQQSGESLAAVEKRILNHYRKIVGERAPVPSLRAFQAPVFHGHAISLHVQFETGTSVEPISSALAGEHVSVISSGDEAPSNVSAAGQSDILVSVTGDAEHRNSAWIWAVSDNLRIAALTAVECAEAMAATRPRGHVQ